jgi:hypothetical protein
MIHEIVEFHTGRRVADTTDLSSCGRVTRSVKELKRQLRDLNLGSCFAGHGIQAKQEES